MAVKTFGIFARTTGIEGINSDGTSAKSARITVTTALRTSNRQKIKVLHTLIGNGAEVAHSETDLSGDETTQIFTVNNPKLWSPEHPVLYVLETSVICNGKLIDQQRTNIGIRTVEYSGEGFKLKPWNMAERDSNSMANSLNFAAFVCITIWDRSARLSIRLHSAVKCVC